MRSGAREGFPSVAIAGGFARKWEAATPGLFRPGGPYVRITEALDEIAPPDDTEASADMIPQAPGEIENVASNKLSLRRPDEILSMAFDESDRILGDRLLAKGQSLTILGAGGIGKSRLLLQLAVAQISERRFLELETS